jgi:VanZ family protein
MVSDSKSEKSNIAATAQTSSATPTGEPRHLFLIALVLALAYLLTIVYASVQPFRNWRMPDAAFYDFLNAPWPYYITLKDVLVNLAAYIPLGFLVTLGLRLRLAPVAAVAGGTVIAIALSILMESVQMFLPSRVATNVDVLANGAGGLIGALAAPLFLPTRALGTRLGTLRDRVFAPGVVPDIGIVLVLLWIATQLNPWTQVMGPGQLRESFDWPDLFAYTPTRLATAETLVVMFNLLGIGLLLSTLIRPGVRRRYAVGMVVTLALAVKVLISLVLEKPQAMWAWLTPGLGMGLLLGLLLLRGLLELHHGARLWMALVCTVLAVIAINLAPGNPYANLPPLLTSGRTSHLLSFSSILSAWSDLWPLLAVGYFSAAIWHHRRGAKAL